MAKIIRKRIFWTPGVGPDVVAHRVYVAKEEEVLDYSSPHIEVPMPNAECFAPDDFPQDIFDEDVNYRVGISAVDDVGNESDIGEIAVPFDFLAPMTPTGIGVEDA